MTKELHKKIYSVIATLLDYEPMPRVQIIEKALRQISRKCSESQSCSVGELTELRANVADVLDELVDHGLVGIKDNGYFLTSNKPVILSTESCEREIIKLLRSGPLSKIRIRESLEVAFGTDKTISQKDDNILHTLIGKVISRLTKIGIIRLTNGLYSITPDKEARLDDIDKMLSVKEDFLTKLHSKGGEFFEHFFMTLLGKYLSIHSKTVEHNEVMGGAHDGGIDGTIITTDSLGFKECIMVQMKNRIEDTSETTVRGFWGSVCAKQGSRGIFATTSGFHPTATAFLDAIDNCVGVDGDKIFAMACECKYGIKIKNGKYTVDAKLF